MKNSAVETWRLIYNQSLEVISLAEQILEAIKAQQQIIDDYRKKFSRSSLAISQDEVGQIAHLLAVCKGNVNTDIRLQMYDLLKQNTQTINRHHGIITSLALCIVDGIVKNYGSWHEWQSIARQVLKDNAPGVARELDCYENVIKYDDAYFAEMCQRKMTQQSGEAPVDADFSSASTKAGLFTRSRASERVSVAEGANGRTPLPAAGITTPTRIPANCVHGKGSYQQQKSYQQLFRKS